MIHLIRCMPWPFNTQCMHSSSHSYKKEVGSRRLIADSLGFCCWREHIILFNTTTLAKQSNISGFWAAIVEHYQMPMIQSETYICVYMPACVHASQRFLHSTDHLLSLQTFVDSTRVMRAAMLI